MPAIPETWDEIDTGGIATTTLTLTGVALAGSNRALYICTGNRFAVSVVGPSRASDTFAEQASSNNSAGGNALRSKVFCSTNEPQAAAANLVVTSGANGTWGFQYVACSGVNQTTRIENLTENSDHIGTGGIAPINIASAVGDLVMDWASGVNNIVLGSPSESSQTERIASTFPSASWSGKMSTKPGEASASMGWNVTSGSDTVIHFAWNIPSADAASPPEQVTGLVAEGYSAERFALTWNQPSGDPSGYKIEISDNDADWSVHTANTGTPATAFYVGGYAPGTTKYWRVSAINASGTGTASSSASATIPSHADQDSLALLDFSDPFLTLIPPYGDSTWTDADLQQIMGMPIAPLLTQNQRPIANAGPDQTVSIGPVQLDGSGSSDPDGDPLFYSWIVLSKPSGSSALLFGATSVTPTLQVDLVGAYIVQLVVSDGKDGSAPDTVVITAGEVPIADAGPDQTIAIGSLVQLDGSGSTLASNYTWSVLQVPAGSLAVLSNASSATPTFLVDLEGPYVFGLTVDDGASPPTASGTDTVTITGSALASITPMFVAAARVVSLPGDTRKVVAAPGVVAPTVWKYPKDLYDVSVDWSGTQVLPAGATALGALSVTIIDPSIGSPNDVSSTLIVNYGDSPVTGYGVEGLVAWVTLQGGTAGKSYTVIFRQTFDNSQVLEKYITIEIRNPRKGIVNKFEKFPNDKFPVPVQWAGRAPRGATALQTLITKAYDAADADETSTYIAGSFVTGTIGACYIIGGTGGESRLIEFAQAFSNGRKFHEYALMDVKVPPA